MKTDFDDIPHFSVLYGPPLVILELKNIRKCRYYHGEDKAPKGVNKRIWGYERIWVERRLDDDGRRRLRNDVAKYKSCGLGSFRKWDHVPISLKALLWSRYSRWVSPSPEDFKDWYIHQYYSLQLNNI